MDSKDYHKVCEEVDDIVTSTCKHKDIIHNLEDMELDETDNSAKGNEVDVNETKMEANEIKIAHEIQTENEMIQLAEPLADRALDITDKNNALEENDSGNILRDTSSSIDHSISPEATTSQDNTPTSSNGIESSCPFTDNVKSKRSISKDPANEDSNISMEKAVNSSDEDSSKRQKLNENACNALKSNDESVDSVPKFRKLKSKGRKRNYRHKRPPTGDNDESCNEEINEDSGMRPETEGATVSRQAENCERGSEINSDGPDVEDADENDSNEWTTASEEELEEAEEDSAVQDTPTCLKKKRPKPNWFAVSELVHREMGINPLFRRKYYGSLHVVEHFELMYKLREHEGCVNALNFNRKGNLLASGSDDLAVVIWNWATGKKHHLIVNSGHRSNMFQAKWLPCDEDNLMATCGRDGLVRLLDIKSGVSRRLAAHFAPTHKLAVHPDTPHIIISVGEDAKVLSIDIREKKPTRLLVVKDGSSPVQLYSVHSNPLKSYEFCVGGKSQAVRIYDRRKVSEPLHKLYPEHLIENYHAHVTCALYNYNGTEIVATYNDEDIYLFDTVFPQAGDFAHRYQGHRNNATVKGVNFFGPKSEFIVSGSDCGHIFIWDKNSEAIVNWMPGDEQGVVNCLEPHPEFPILATSGLDFDVKIWVPSCEYPPNFTGLAACVKYNAIYRAHEAAAESDVFTNHLNWVVVRTIGRRNRIRALNILGDTSSPNPDDDDDGEVDDDDGEVDVDTSDDSSVYSDSQSDGPAIRTLQCPPS